MDIVVEILGGLGLFFIGVKLIGANLQQMSGRRLRSAVARTTRRPAAAALIGTAAGALTQSTSAVTFVAVNMVTAGLIEARRSVPLVIWANVGTAALVMLATLNIHLMILALLGIVGALYYFGLDRSARWRHAVGALLGLALLFLGLDMVKASAAPLREMEEVRDVIAFTAGSGLLAFLAGAVLTLIAQSSATVSVVAVAMVSVGLLTSEQTVLLIYGAGVGSGLSIRLLGSNLSGTARQLVELQLINKLIGAAILVPLFLIEHSFGLPLLQTAVATLADNSAAQAAWHYLIYQLVAALAVSAITGPLFRMVERWRPPTAAEELSRPQYLYEAALAEPETALDLVLREQGRLLGYLSDSLDTIRPEMAGRTATPHAALDKAGRALGAEIHAFIGAALAGGLVGHGLDKAIRAQNRMTLLSELQESVGELVMVLDRADIPKDLSPLAHGLVESAHLVVETLRDEARAFDPVGHSLLLSLTADRSDMMDRIRKSMTTRTAALSPRDQDLLFTITTLFERVVWLVRRYAMQMDANDGMVDETVPQAAPAQEDALKAGAFN
ncbi:Na/Pi symporter [Telmatospirillum sp. J64-1]|uniref:Na/Pi symporter n=1 Tax=Telmatospirillum sp. J64-1 TaxID=2502183 RepID=UPI00115CA2E6|nr:Na/Pi symporter [Telmatospirillum sp. J64-1]